MDPLLAAATSLRERCWAALPGHHGEGVLGPIRRVLEDLHGRLGAPACAGTDVTWLAEGVELSTTGLVVHSLLRSCPDAARTLLSEEVLDVVRSVLGSDLHLESSAAVLSDASRPHFPWHMHVGGIDDELLRRRGEIPTYERHERVAMLVYLQPIDEPNGQLWVMPRSVGEPVRAPHPVDALDWPGAVPVEGSAGTVVFLEEGTWHSVRQRRLPGLRAFVGFWFAAAHGRRAHTVDRSLAELGELEPRLVSLLRGSR